MTEEKLKRGSDSLDAVRIKTDGWTTIRIESNFSIAAHKINSNMDLKYSLRDCFKCDEKHPAVN